MGDLNLDLIKFSDKPVFLFINLMLFFSLLPLITRPTRITETSATLIDQVRVSRADNNVSNYVIHADITDHFPVISQLSLTIQYIIKLHTFQKDI